MNVQLVSKLDPAAEALRLGQWAANYRQHGGQGGPGGLLAPGRAAGERWVAVIRGVGRDEIDQRDLADPDVLLGHGRTRDPAHQAWVSPQRVVFAGGRRVLEAWPLDELFAVQALDDLTGAVLLVTEPNPDYDDRFPALLSDVVPWSSSAPGPAPPEAPEDAIAFEKDVRQGGYAGMVTVGEDLTNITIGTETELSGP